ncbi:MAG: aminopeptidase [Planctomycetota bacterium]
MTHTVSDHAARFPFINATHPLSPPRIQRPGAPLGARTACPHRPQTPRARHRHTPAAIEPTRDFKREAVLLGGGCAPAPPRGRSAWRCCRVAPLGVALWIAACAFSGCSTPYLVRQAAGQVRILASARPIATVQDDPATRDSLRAPLDEVAAALEFADASGLTVGSAYGTVVDLGSRPPVWVLYACPPDRIAPRLWSFPVVGEFPYKGFFDLAAARRAARMCQREGLETVVLPAGAYSTLGWFPDPLFSSFLEGDAGARLETLFHELTHQTLFVRGSVRLNENLADFVGELLARRFIGEHHGATSSVLHEYEADVQDRQRFREIVLRARDRLTEAFASDSRAERLDARARVFAQLMSELNTAPFVGDRYRGWAAAEWNLALLVALDTYRGEQEVFRSAFVRCGEDLPTFFRQLHSLWSGAEDPLGRLQSWLESAPI